MSETSECPHQVRAIADRWGGAGAPVQDLGDGVWSFRCADLEDGFVYEVYAPGYRYTVYEDSGRPVGRTGSLPRW